MIPLIIRVLVGQLPPKSIAPLLRYTFHVLRQDSNDHIIMCLMYLSYYRNREHDIENGKDKNDLSNSATDLCRCHARKTCSADCTTLMIDSYLITESSGIKYS
jgi:hypothetical protein